MSEPTNRNGSSGPNGANNANGTPAAAPLSPLLAPPPTGAVTTGGPTPTLAARLAAGLVSALVLAGVVAASHLLVTFHPSDDALLRVAWSARPERVESCRTLSEEELEKLPAHMRQRVVCEGTTARYRLDILRDGQPLSSTVLRGGGLRHDRQLYAFQELPVPHGSSTFEVTLTRLDGGGPAGGDADGEGASRGGADGTAVPAPTTDREQRELEEHRRRVEDEVPSSLSMSETVTLAPREVALLTYDPGSRGFRLVRREAAGR